MRLRPAWVKNRKLINALYLRVNNLHSAVNDIDSLLTKQREIAEEAKRSALSAHAKIEKIYKDIDGLKSESHTHTRTK